MRVPPPLRCRRNPDRREFPPWKPKCLTSFLPRWCRERNRSAAPREGLHAASDRAPRDRSAEPLRRRELRSHDDKCDTPSPRAPTAPYDTLRSFRATVTDKGAKICSCRRIDRARGRRGTGVAIVEMQPEPPRSPARGRASAHADSVVCEELPGASESTVGAEDIPRLGETFPVDGVAEAVERTFTLDRALQSLPRQLRLPLDEGRHVPRTVRRATPPSPTTTLAPSTEDGTRVAAPSGFSRSDAESRRPVVPGSAIGCRRPDSTVGDRSCGVARPWRARWRRRRRPRRESAGSSTRSTRDPVR